jgi:hypothetical protein
MGKITFKLQTGNLSAALVQTVRLKTDTKADDVAPDGSRFDVISYKVTDKQKAKAAAKAADSVFPLSFRVTIPAVTLADIQAKDKGPAFLLSVFQEYQHALLGKSANREIEFDPTDLNAVIVDHFDTSRSRSAPTKPLLIEWVDGDFMSSFILRRETLKADGVKDVANYDRQTDAVMGQCKDQIIRAKSDNLSIEQAKGLRNTFDKLAEHADLDIETGIGLWVYNKLQELEQPKVADDGTIVASDAV